MADLLRSTRGRMELSYDGFFYVWDAIQTRCFFGGEFGPA